MKKNKALIEAAVNWFVEKLKQPAREGLPGDRESHQSLMYMFSRIMVQKNDQPSEAKIENFRKLLIKYLEGEAKNGRDRVNLSTDYSPEWPLSDICVKTGITGLEFPQKMNMWINFKDGTVTWRQVHGHEGQIFPVVKVQKQKVLH
ncbi:MAG TPA: hypothetical protein VIH31_03045 [Candidatus Paceibacterota bacterium]